MAEVENTAEETAAENGWKDQEAWVEAGNPAETHVSAEVFNVRGDFIGDLKAQERQIKELERNQSEFSKILKQENAKAAERVRKEMQAAHKEAVEAGDVETAQNILQQQQETAVDANEAVFQKWQGDNADWLENNLDVYEKALTVDKFFSKGREITDMASHLDKVTARLREEFSDDELVFRDTSGRAVNAKKPGARLTEADGGQVRSKAKGKHTFADLDEESQIACRKMVQSDVMTEKEYIEAIFGSD